MTMTTPTRSPGALVLSDTLRLPLDAVTRTFGILAVRGAGKSNTAAVMAEEMFAANLPFVVIDPVGSWYGLRSSADGTRPGLPVPIFGGKYGDVELARGAGEMVADLVVDGRLTCVLDLSRFESEADKKRFLLAFAKRLYLQNESPLHLFLEEADDFIPQRPMADETLLLRAWENIVRRGRSRGLGMTLITQRSAAVAKMVLTQVETLFAMRTTGPQDIKAIEAWVKYHQVGKEVLSTLAGLEDGEAWVWSPHYLKTMTRHQIRRRRTYDSGATPHVVGEGRRPMTLADIDLPALRRAMILVGREPAETRQGDGPHADPPVMEPVRYHLKTRLTPPAGVGLTQPKEETVTKGEAKKLTEENAALKAEVARLVKLLTPPSVTPVPLGDGDGRSDRGRMQVVADEVLSDPDTVERLYQEFKGRIISEEPAAVLKLLQSKPRIVVEVTPRVVTYDGNTTKGRIARLMAEGWFAEPRAAAAVRTELSRIGADPGGGTADHVSDFAKAGFLVREGTKFRLAPGAEVTKTTVRVE
jgi:hypothetical protein